MRVTLQEYKEAVEEIIKHSQAYPFDIDCSEIIKQWYENKQYFINLFGGALKVESTQELEFFLDENGKNSCFSDFMDKLSEYNLGKVCFEGVSVYSFLYTNKGSFFDNKVSIIPEELSNQSKIRVGDKLIKSLKFFFKEPSELKIVQNLASQYVQKNKVKGKLFLSVDPIDYLLASENNENWRSCHALDGEFRSGNMSYMLDSSTVIAYVASESKQYLNMAPGDMEHHSKKLRVFVHWTKDSHVLYFSKTYPFDAPHLRAKIKEWVNSLYRAKVFSGEISEQEARNFSMPELVGFNQINFGSVGRGSRYLDNNWIYHYGNIINTRDVISIPEHSLNYNDIINSSNYSPYVCFEDNSWRYDSELEKLFHMEIGSAVPCARCGKNHITDSAKFICNECARDLDMRGDYFCHCYDCGRRLWEEDDVYHSECWGEEVTYCHRCYVPDYDDEDYF